MIARRREPPKKKMELFLICKINSATFSLQNVNFETRLQIVIFLYKRYSELFYRICTNVAVYKWYTARL